MKKLLTALTIITVATTPAMAKTKIIAKVNNVTITQQDLDNLLDSLPPQYDKNDPKLKKELIKFLIDQEILVQEARKEGIDKDPKVKKQIENAIKQILATALLNKKIPKSKIKVTDKEVKAFYEKHKSEFKGLNGKPVPFNQIKNFLEAQLIKQKQQQAVEEYINSIKKNYNVTITGEGK